MYACKCVCWGKGCRAGPGRGGGGEKGRWEGGAKGRGGRGERPGKGRGGGGAGRRPGQREGRRAWGKGRWYVGGMVDRPGGGAWGGEGPGREGRRAGGAKVRGGGGGAGYRNRWQERDGQSSEVLGAIYRQKIDISTDTLAAKQTNKKQATVSLTTVQ